MMEPRSKLGVLAFEFLDPGIDARRHPRPLPGVDLLAFDPTPQRLSLDVEKLTGEGERRGRVP